MYDESIKYARMCGYFKGRLMVLSMACIPGITIHSRKAFDDYIMDIVNNAESEVMRHRAEMDAKRKATNVLS